MCMIYIYIHTYTYIASGFFDIAMENGPFIGDFPIEPLFIVNFPLLYIPSSTNKAMEYLPFSSMIYRLKI